MNARWLWLVLCAGCVETASAQTPPRADAGWRMQAPPGTTGGPRGALREAVASGRRNAALLSSLSSDAGSYAGLFGAVHDGRVFGFGGLAMASSDAGVGGILGGRDRWGLGMRGAESRGGGAGMGAMGALRPRVGARFEEVTAEGAIPRGHAVAELARLGPRVQNCLGAAGSPADASVRFVVRRDGSVAEVVVDGAPPALARCATEQLGRALFGPSDPATVVRSRLRVGLFAADGGVRTP